MQRAQAKKVLWITVLVTIFIITGVWLVLTRLDLRPTKYKEVVRYAGNTYADPEFYKDSISELPIKVSISELPKAVAEQFKIVVPNPVWITLEIESDDKDLIWVIDTRSDDGRSYSLKLWLDGRIRRINSRFGRVVEAGGRIFYPKKIQRILVDQVPEQVLKNTEPLRYGLELTKAYSVDAVGGHRYFIQFGRGRKSMVISLTDKGEIRSAGKASSMLKPITWKIETLDEIASNLSKYGNKYHVEEVIAKIQTINFDKQDGFRFVVVGDTRSNRTMWKTIAQSLNKWQPVFVINLGDMTRYGYSNTMKKYLFPVIEKYVNHLFLPVMGNHDCRRGSLSYEYAFGGGSSRVYHFDYGDCRFIILDNVEGEGMMSWEEQLALAEKWLSEKSDYRRFVFVHSPPYEVEKWAYHSMPSEMSAPFVKLMSKYKVDHVFSGHIHASSTATYGGVDYTVTGGGGASLHSHYGEFGSVHHYMVVDVLPENIKIKVVYFLPIKN